jgi:polyhydroxybutyrate depolymerase
MLHKIRLATTAGISAILVSLSTGCSSQASSQVVEESILYDGLARHYLVYEPPGLKAPMAVVLSLHGYGSSASHQMRYTNMNAVADTAGFIVVYPDAAGNRWNSGIADNPRWPTPKVDDVGFIDALIDALEREYSIDLDRVYVCGMSNGGFMSFRLACQLSHRISAVASVTGVISANTALDCTPQEPVPVFYIHGTDDPTVPYNGTFGWLSAEQTVNHWASIHGCFRADTTALPDTDPLDGSTVTKITYADSSGNAEVIFCEIAGGGHTWPGAPFDLLRGGHTNRDINASEEIWRFFLDR